MKKNIFFGAISIIVIGAGLWVWSSAEQAKNAAPTQVTGDTIFFFGQECPHCLDVEKFIADNKIADKVKYDSLEVWHNNANMDLMTKKAKECGLSSDQIGVPLVFSKGKCYVGTPDAEKFFQDAANQAAAQ